MDLMALAKQRKHLQLACLRDKVLTMQRKFSFFSVRRPGVTPEPIRATDDAAGFDLAAPADIVIPAHGQRLIATDIKFSFQDNVQGLVVGRSGLSRRGIRVANELPIFDADGFISLVLINTTDEEYEVKRGHRIAQLIMQRTFNLAQFLEINQDGTGRGQIFPLTHSMAPQMRGLVKENSVFLLGNSDQRRVVIQPNKHVELETVVRISNINNGIMPMLLGTPKLCQSGVCIPHETCSFTKYNTIRFSIYNFGTEPYALNEGALLAQIIFCQAFEVEALKRVDTISTTARGENGFGSTGN